jgi:hypothetical protein
MVRMMWQCEVVRGHNKSPMRQSHMERYCTLCTLGVVGVESRSTDGSCTSTSNTVALADGNAGLPTLAPPHIISSVGSSCETAARLLSCPIASRNGGVTSVSITAGAYSYFRKHPCSL